VGQEIDFVIITGLSGAGRTLALRVFEDNGFFCIDNLPPQLILKFAELCSQSRKKLDKVALVIDIRGGDFFDSLFESLKSLEEMGYSYRILFLDASDEVLIKRYKESRRKHPLAPDKRIIEGINLERKKLAPVKEKSDFIIDTSFKTPAQLKEEIEERFLKKDINESGLLINIVSFGFKQGLPLDADLVFDVRFLPNPFYKDELRPLSGNDEKVRDYIFNFQETREFINKVFDLIEFLIPYYIKEGKAQLVVAIGCTGGRHRSIAIANELAKLLKDKGYFVNVEHRDEKDSRGY